MSMCGLKNRGQDLVKYVLNQEYKVNLGIVSHIIVFKDVHIEMQAI